jgi:hypothetical protein
MLLRYLQLFKTDETAAITVDFVVLTAAVALLGLTVVTVFYDAAVLVAVETADAMTAERD